MTAGALAEIEARISGMAPTVDDAKLERRMLRYQSVETADVCGSCGRSPQSDEPVVHTMESGGRTPFGGWSTVAVVVCTDCAPMVPSYRFRPCEYCGRHTAFCTGRVRSRRFCSGRCRSRSASARAKWLRARARQKTCVGCEQEFDGTRRDAKYCSSPCRQRAYRHRVTASESVDDASSVTDGKMATGGAFNTRNGS